MHAAATHAAATVRSSALGRLAAPAGVAALAAAGCVGIWFADPTTPGGPIPVCPTKALLGIDCPGCGSCRMVYSLLHGNIGAAMHYNALGVLGVVVLAVSFLTWTLGRVRGRRFRGWQHWRYSPAVALVLVIGWFIVRNIPVAPFTALKV